jgi:hypothetical protein
VTPADALDGTYARFLEGLTALFADPASSPQAKLAGGATDEMITATGRAQQAIRNAHDHGTGVLRDRHRVVTRRGESAMLSDCLDEVNWYVVRDATGSPDPSVTRGYFVGRATLVERNGRWYVDTWGSVAQSCTW